MRQHFVFISKMKGILTRVLSLWMNTRLWIIFSEVEMLEKDQADLSAEK